MSDDGETNAEATTPPLFSAKEGKMPPYGKPSYNNKAKDATGIDFPLPTKRIKTLKPRDLESIKRFLPGANLQTIKKTLEATTQYGSRGALGGNTLRQQVQSSNPALNIPRRNEDVATDTLCSNTPAVDDGSTACQFFIGRISKFRTVVPLGKSDKNYPLALMEVIRKYGAMNRIISDGAKAELSSRVKDICRTLIIGDWQSEPEQQRQNFSERGWRDTRSWSNNILNISNAPPECWLLVVMHVVFLQNHLAHKSLGWRTPAEWLLGHTPDTSVMLQFTFYEPVYYAKYEGLSLIHI